MLNISVILKRYSVPAIFLVLGIMIMTIAFKENQTMEFKLSGVLILVGAIISLLSSSSLINALTAKIIGGFSLVTSGFLLFYSYQSVGETMQYQANYKACKAEAIRNLSDIRTAQKAYFENYNTYANSWGELMKYINTGTVNTVVAEGEKPSRRITEAERNFLYKDSRAIDNNMTDQEAYLLSKSKICPDDLKGFKRDTIKVSFLKTTFTENISYIKERRENGFGKFNLDNLKYIPFTNKKSEWKIKTDKVVVGIDSVSTLRIEGVIPFTKIVGSKKKETMFIGKLEMNDLSGSWEEE
jgi:hypothetical protein